MCGSKGRQHEAKDEMNHHHDGPMRSYTQTVNGNLGIHPIRLLNLCVNLHLIMWQALVLLAVVVIGLRTIYIRLQPKTLVSYPPGPPGKPFIGNLFDIPAPFTQPGPYAFWSGLVAKYGVYRDPSLARD
jgi:hypothetical protein